jgi:hypothetical protein
VGGLDVAARASRARNAGGNVISKQCSEDRGREL